jgi:hypothetical protein
MNINIQDTLVTEYKDPETGKSYWIDRFGSEYEPLDIPGVTMAMGAIDPNAIANLATSVLGLFKKKEKPTAPGNLQPGAQQVLPVIIQQPASSNNTMYLVAGGVGLLFVGALIKRLLT